MAFVEGLSLKRPFSLSRVGKIASRRGVENRGSLISVPLALRDFLFRLLFPAPDLSRCADNVLAMPCLTM